ncbi:hypothetical protein Pelo_7199 [Pelomyxa schiedti]|nr:hypothetical protein Pelo_7199 [Pelomyxa schiedti]
MQDEGERSHLYVVHANTEPTTETEEPSDCNVQTVTVPTTTTTTTTTCTMDSAAATNMSFVELASLLSTAIKSPTLPKKPKAKTTTTTTEPPCINPDGSMETNSESGCDSSDESNDASTDEEAYVPTKREVYDRTHAVVRRNQQFVDTIYQQRGKVIAQDAKKLLKVIKKQEETKVLIEKGQLLLAEWKSSEQAQKLQAEGEEFLTKIQDNPEYSQLFNEGKIFLRCLKDSNATIEPSQIETILVHSKNLAERFSDDPQCESLIDLARSALREVRAQERHKEKWLERKKWLEEFILQADPEISETLKPLMEEGGKFLDDLKATDTLKMLNETKKILKSLLEEHTKSVLSGDGEEHVNMGTILTDGKRWVTDVVDEIEETDGKSEKFDKIVARASSATSDPEAQELISKGHKLVCGIMSNERSRKIIHHGKNVVKQISRTPEVKTLVEHTKQMIIDVATREQFHELLIENKQFLMDMKQVIIPFITEHIITVKIPPISGSKDSAFGSVSYEIWDIVLSGLDLLPENVNLDYDKVTKLVTLSVLNFDAHIRSFSWKYNKHTWPRISDSGSALYFFHLGKEIINVVITKKC